MQFNFIKDIKKKRNKKKPLCDTKTMGVDIDKNEYYEIITSNSAHPEKFHNRLL
ncbi:hypothetical protein IJF81_03990 [bacterium]|nr:hypothetical protein [bacterium]